MQSVLSTAARSTSILTSLGSTRISLARLSASATASPFLKSFMDLPGPVSTSIQSKLTQRLKPSVLEVFDDSSKHKGHAAMKGLSPSETHFRLVIVADAFEAKSLVQRHKLVYEILEEELKTGVHALSLTTKTPEEYAKMQAAQQATVDKMQQQQ
eukprot:jgi/Hompol1/489/HPOL_005326-RA